MYNAAFINTDGRYYIVLDFLYIKNSLKKAIMVNLHLKSIQQITILRVLVD